jgi:hypothetical protein
MISTPSMDAGGSQNVRVERAVARQRRGSDVHHQTQTPNPVAVLDSVAQWAGTMMIGGLVREFESDLSSFFFVQAISL